MTDVGLELLPPEEVTSSHVTVAPPGFCCFGLVQQVDSRAALHSLVLLFWQRSTRSLFVLLLPSNINLGQVGPGHTHSHPEAPPMMQPHLIYKNQRRRRVLCTQCCQSNSSSSQLAVTSSLLTVAMSCDLSGDPRVPPAQRPGVRGDEQ